MVLQSIEMEAWDEHRLIRHLPAKRQTDSLEDKATAALPPLPACVPVNQRGKFKDNHYSIQFAAKSFEARSGVFNSRLLASLTNPEQNPKMRIQTWLHARSSSDG